MHDHHLNDHHSRERYDTYHVRMLSCIAAALLFTIGAVQLWPAWPEEEAGRVFDDHADEFIDVDDIQPTQQERSAAPPAPLPPVPVPDEVELEELDLDFSALADADLAEDLVEQEGQADETHGSAPDEPPRQLRLAEPDYPEEARREGIRARVVVEVLVGEDGRAVEAAILERALLDEEGRQVEEASQLGYGLDEAALEAARRTTFIPAQSGGEPASSRTTITIRFGV